MLIIKAGDTLLATIPIKNNGTLKGNISLVGDIVRQDTGIVVAQLRSYAGELSLSQEIEAGETKNFSMRLQNWANGNSALYPQGTLFDVEYKATVIETTKVVNAVDISKLSHEAGQAKPPKPDAPVRVSSSAPTSTQASITVGWENVIANPVVLDWTVFRGTTNIGVVGPNVFQFTDMNCVPGHSYNYKVRARNSLGHTDSDYTNMIAATYVPPYANVMPRIQENLTWFEPSQIGPGGTFKAHIFVTNIGPDAGTITIEVLLFDVATGTYQGRLRDEANDNQYFSTMTLDSNQQDSLIMYNRNFGNGNPDSWPNDTWFRCVVICKVGEEVRDEKPFANVTKWVTSTTPPDTKPPKPDTYQCGSQAFSSTNAEASLCWNPVTADPAVSSYKVYDLIGGSWKLSGTYGASGPFTHKFINLLPGSGFWTRVVANNGQDSNPGEFYIQVAHWSDPQPGDVTPYIYETQPHSDVWASNPNRSWNPPNPCVIMPGSIAKCQITIKNLDDNKDGDMTIWIRVVNAGTELTAATLFQDGLPEKSYLWHAGEEKPVWGQHTGWGSTGFFDGQLFDVLIKATPASGNPLNVRWGRIRNCFVFQSSGTTPPPTPGEPGLTVSANNLVITATATLPSGADFVQLYGPDGWWEAGPTGQNFTKQWTVATPNTYTIRARACKTGADPACGPENVKQITTTAPPPSGSEPPAPYLFANRAGATWIEILWMVPVKEGADGGIAERWITGPGGHKLSDRAYTPGTNYYDTFSQLQPQTTYTMTVKVTNSYSDPTKPVQTSINFNTTAQE